MSDSTNLFTCFTVTYLLIVVTIGFDPILYRVNEGDGVATLTIRVLAGNLAKEARLFFSTENGTAQGIVVTPTHSPTHPLTHSLTHPLTHPLTH